MAGQIDQIDNMSILSYNTTGWNSFKANFIKEIISSRNIDIFAIQEHFMLEQNVFKIQEQFSDFELFALPAFKNNSQITRGRPSGGLALLYKNSLSTKINRLVSPNSNRVQGIKLNLDNNIYVFINVYFPVDKRNDNIDDLIVVLQEIRNL